MKKTIYVTLLLCMAMSACTDNKESVSTSDATHLQEEIRQDLIQCPENRPEMCIEIYQPVCGLVDTGIRCITTPCPSTDYKTFGNSCTACADPNVTGYIDGECPTEDAASPEHSPAE